jgi:spore coat protein CotH
MEPISHKTTDRSKSLKSSKIDENYKLSTKSADDKVLFKVEDHFIDDY